MHTNQVPGRAILDEEQSDQGLFVNLSLAD